MRTAPYSRLAAAIAMIAALFGGEALAQADVCAGLEARLASLDGGDEGFGASRKIEAAIERQRGDLDRVMAEARRGGCLSGLFAVRKPGRNCGPIKQTVAKMRANLNRLNVQRKRQAFPAFSAGRERSKLLRQLATNQCGEHYAAFDDRPRNVFGSLFGGQRPRFGGWGSDGLGYDGGLELGTYRTLCVRTCDGYYFPISFSTVPSNFGADEQACRAACPGTDVTLYSYRNPGEDVGAMISLAGEPYSALPTAFKYRKTYDAACACRGGVAANPGQGSASGSFVTIGPPEPAALPKAEPAPAAKGPETSASEEATAVPKKAAETPETPWVAGVGPDGRKVRIVGPRDFVAQ
jgi:hypothetical protein